MHPTTPQQQFHNNLRSLKANLPALRAIAAKKATVMARTQGHGTRTTAPIPLNLGAWQLLQDIGALVDAMRRACGLPSRGMGEEELIKGVMLHESRLLERADAPAVMELAAQAARRMDRMLNPPPETKMIGWCPGCGTELRCDQLELDSGWKACDRCGLASRIKDVHRLSMLRLAVGGAQGTAASISRLLAPWGIDIKRNTITQWDRRGLIRPVDYDADGSPVYLVWDVWQAHAAKKSK